MDTFGFLAAGIAMTVASSDDDKEDSKEVQSKTLFLVLFTKIHGPTTVNDIKSALQW